MPIQGKDKHNLKQKMLNRFFFGLFFSVFSESKSITGGHMNLPAPTQIIFFVFSEGSGICNINSGYG